MASLRLNLSTLRLTPRLAKPLPSQSRVLRGCITSSIHRRPLSTHPLRAPPLTTLSSFKKSPPSTRRFSTGKSQADLLVEELQELYETAKDEFEIATDSTASSTIYAASDRESARDALNQLLAVYSLYTTDIAATAESHAPQQMQQGNGDESGQLVNTNFDPSDIPARVRDEVRRRVGHRVRELSNAVEVLEERAHAE
ncbi:hypothetical protein CNMCM8980_008857 [Aspergillus fumigatiaffinis]|uniref:Uncharacterized protein n=1 Tax=Aspergillus fumigatiaffinis TaxID=340414 RepID=A0A8H4H3U7_9EURO|nr:hypothetical protein CNMCM5878_008540 [Aspergillus fumigatiaffinis]KAF4225266.1 hypothetical protein CNMCM6457_008409 [Aspergillus fumigatiaffinis]KAF4235503.1 hypothetical protein CNMCM6805_007937 [Aspergillus fumigatiaffinis]KAF4246143.1 hypothetical protein CNMCM8980_008857 [Aspergillus fumigatiaffinis]